MKNEDHFNEVFNRGIKQRLDPAVKDYFHKTELAKRVFPRLRYSLASTFSKFLSNSNLCKVPLGFLSLKLRK